MPTSLPLLNALSAPKTASSTTQSKSAIRADEGAPTFKQSMQKATPKDAAPAVDKQPGVDEQSQAGADGTIQPGADGTVQAGADGTMGFAQLPMELVHLLGARHSLAGAPLAGVDGAGLSYLASLAGGGLDGNVMPAPNLADSAGALVIGESASILPSAGMDESLTASLMPFAAATGQALGAEATMATQSFGRGSAERTQVSMSSIVPVGGKVLPHWLTASADPAIALQSPTSGGTTTFAGGASFDATALSAGLLSTPMQSGGGASLKAFLADGALGSVNTAGLSGEQAGAIGEASDGFTQTLSASALASTSASAFQLEGRTAIPMTLSFGHSQWSNNLAERTLWMAGQAIHSAEIQLDPPELGPLQVRIQVNQDQASVSFVSANPQVRDALEQTMGRLRELFQEQGLDLVDSGVADHQSKQQREQNDSGERSAGLPSDEGQEALASPDLQTLVTPVPWGVDYYV